MKLEIVFKDGRKETFGNIESFNVTEEQTTTIPEVVAETPTEGKLFKVNPQDINRSLFSEKRRDKNQERTRKMIQDAFMEVDKHPEKYACPFCTLIPEKNWKGNRVVSDLKLFANDLGGKMADWVEQALEWAQRIANGESWETICNNADTANWYRIIVWNRKIGYVRLVGSSCIVGTEFSPSQVSPMDIFGSSFFNDAVPLIVIKKKQPV